MDCLIVSGETKTLSLDIGDLYLIEIVSAASTTGDTQIHNVLNAMGDDVKQVTFISGTYESNRAIALVKVSKSYTITTTVGVVVAYTELVK